MTREIKPAAQSAANRAASLLTGALLLAGLAGCGGSLLQLGDTADATLKAKPAIALSQADGVPQKYASKVNEQLTASIRAKGVQIVEAKDAQYIIKTTFAAKPDAKHGTKVAYTDRRHRQGRQQDSHHWRRSPCFGQARRRLLEPRHRRGPAASRCEVGHRCVSLDRQPSRSCYHRKCGASTRCGSGCSCKGRGQVRAQARASSSGGRNGHAVARIGG